MKLQYFWHLQVLHRAAALVIICAVFIIYFIDLVCAVFGDYRLTVGTKSQLMYALWREL